MTFWGGRRVLLTGGNGFLGKALRAELARRGANDVLAPTRRDLDLLEKTALHEQVTEGVLDDLEVSARAGNRTHLDGVALSLEGQGVHVLIVTPTPAPPQADAAKSGS